MEVYWRARLTIIYHDSESLYYLINFVKTEDMDKELFIERFSLLPEELQFQVYDYIEFLINRYSLKTKYDKQDEISQELKNLLNDRIAKYEKNPENIKTWDEIEDRLMKKYSNEV